MKSRTFGGAIEARVRVAESAGVTSCFYESAIREKIVGGPNIAVEVISDMSM